MEKCPQYSSERWRDHHNLSLGTATVSPVLCDKTQKDPTKLLGHRAKSSTAFVENIATCSQRPNHLESAVDLLPVGSNRTASGFSQKLKFVIFWEIHTIIQIKYVTYFLRENDT